MDFLWYDIISNTNIIEQGDFVNDCPIVKPPTNINLEGENDIEINLIDTIILSQSCDLVNDKIQIVLVCPYFTKDTFIENLPIDQQSPKAVRKHIDNLKKGFLPGYHLLNKDEANNINDFIIVDFRNVYGIDIKCLREIVESRKKRIRLLPPYREHLSQAFARYFMRVGLPQDIIID